MRFVFASLFCLSVFADSPARLLDTAPIRFEPNHTGPGSVRWTARGLGYAFWFTDEATMLRVGDRTLRLTLDGGRRGAGFKAEGKPGLSTNYFAGPQFTSVPGFSRLRRVDAYPGIDVVYYGNGRQIEYDFEIAPGADPSQIRMRFDGADAVRLNDRGEIVLTLGSGEMIQRAPVVYQRTSRGEIVSIAARYQLEAGSTARLALGPYNPAGALVIDPVISYSAYLHGSSADTGIALGHDAKGFVYIAGNTLSPDFPATGDSYRSTNSGNQDVWVMKLNPAAQAGEQVILYCSYLGGGATEFLKDMAVDGAGVVYITGSTNSAAFPVTPGALQSTISSNRHAFVSVLDTSQTGSAGLVYSTYLGGKNFEEGDGIAVAGGKIYVTGFTTSDDFPVGGAYQAARVAGYDAFVVEIDPAQSGAASLVAGTYLGGSGQDVGRAIAVDAAGNVYIAGITYSYDFPITAANAYQISYISGGDAFLAKLNLGAGTLLYSTYIGGTFTDEVKKIVIEPSGRVALAGYTLSPDFPLTQGAMQTTWGGNGNAFLAILDPAAPVHEGLVYSTYFGGSGGEVAYDLRRDAAGRYYLGGYTMSGDLPVTANAPNRSSKGGAIDGFIAVIDPAAPPFSGRGLVYSSYLTSAGINVVYGVDVDATGAIYATGSTTSSVFPSGGAGRDNDIGKTDAFLMILTIP